MTLETVVIASKVISVLLPLAILALYAFSVYRTGSAHIIFVRIWKILVGKHPISDPAVAKFIDEQYSLTSFTFFSGLRPKTLEQTRKLISWAEERGINLREVARSGTYFDPEKLRIDNTRLPKKSMAVALAIALVALSLVAAMLTAWGMGASRAYLSFRDNGQWFSLTENSAKAMFSGATMNLTPAVCKFVRPERGYVPGLGFNKEQTENLCKFFASRDVNAQVKEYLRSQRLAILLLLAILSLPLVLLIRVLGTASNARKLSAMLEGATRSDETTKAAPATSQTDRRMN